MSRLREAGRIPAVLSTLAFLALAPEVLAQETTTYSANAEYDHSFHDGVVGTDIRLTLKVSSSSAFSSCSSFNGGTLHGLQTVAESSSTPSFTAYTTGCDAGFTCCEELVEGTSADMGWFVAPECTWVVSVSDDTQDCNEATNATLDHYTFPPNLRFEVPGTTYDVVSDTTFNILADNPAAAGVLYSVQDNCLSQTSVTQSGGVDTIELTSAGACLDITSISTAAPSALTTSTTVKQPAQESLTINPSFNWVDIAPLTSPAVTCTNDISLTFDFGTRVTYGGVTDGDFLTGDISLGDEGSLSSRSFESSSDGFEKNFVVGANCAGVDTFTYVKLSGNTEAFADSTVVSDLTAQSFGVIYAATTGVTLAFSDTSYASRDDTGTELTRVDIVAYGKTPAVITEDVLTTSCFQALESFSVVNRQEQWSTDPVTTVYTLEFLCPVVQTLTVQIASGESELTEVASSWLDRTNGASNTLEVELDKVHVQSIGRTSGSTYHTGSGTAATTYDIVFNKAVDLASADTDIRFDKSDLELVGASFTATALSSLDGGVTVTVEITVDGKEDVKVRLSNMAVFQSDASEGSVWYDGIGGESAIWEYAKVLVTAAACSATKFTSGSEFCVQFTSEYEMANADSSDIVSGEISGVVSPTIVDVAGDFSFQVTFTAPTADSVTVTLAEDAFLTAYDSKPNDEASITVYRDVLALENAVTHTGTVVADWECHSNQAVQFIVDFYGSSLSGVEDADIVPVNGNVVVGGTSTSGSTLIFSILPGPLFGHPIANTFSWSIPPGKFGDEQGRPNVAVSYGDITSCKLVTSLSRVGSSDTFFSEVGTPYSFALSTSVPIKQTEFINNVASLISVTPGTGVTFGTPVFSDATTVIVDITFAEKEDNVLDVSTAIEASPSPLPEAGYTLAAPLEQDFGHLEVLSMTSSTVYHDGSAAFTITVTMGRDYDDTDVSTSSLTVSGGSVTGFSATGNDFVFTVTPAGTGTVTAQLPAGAITQDTTSYPSEAAADVVVEYNAIPVLSIAPNSGDGTFSSDSTITVLVVLQYEADGVDAADLITSPSMTVDNARTDGGDNTRWLFDVHVTGYMDVTLSVVDGAFSDSTSLRNNKGLTATNALKYTYLHARLFLETPGTTFSASSDSTFTAYLELNTAPAGSLGDSGTGLNKDNDLSASPAAPTGFRFDESDLSIASLTDVSGSPPTGAVSGAKVYAVVVTLASVAQDYSLSVVADSIESADGRTLEVAGPLAIDHETISVSISGPSTFYFLSPTQYTVRVLFSEPLTNFGGSFTTDDITSSPSVTFGTPVAVAGSSNYAYDVSVEFGAKAAHSMSISADVFSDTDGRNNSATASAFETEYFMASVTLTRSSAAEFHDGQTGTELVLDATFSEAVTGFSASDVVVTGTAATPVVAGSGTAWTITVAISETETLTDDITVTVANGTVATVADAARKVEAPASAFLHGYQYFVVEVASTNGPYDIYTDGDGSTFYVAITASDAMDTASITSGDFTTVPSGALTFDSVAFSSGDTVANITFTVNSATVFTLSIAAGAITSADLHYAGRTNSELAATTIMYRFFSVSMIDAYHDGSTATFTVSTDGTLAVLNADDLTFSGDAPTSVVITPAGVAAASFSVTVGIPSSSEWEDISVVIFAGAMVESSGSVPRVNTASNTIKLYRDSINLVLSRTGARVDHDGAGGTSVYFSIVLSINPDMNLEADITKLKAVTWNGVATELKDVDSTSSSSNITITFHITPDAKMDFFVNVETGLFMDTIVEGEIRQSVASETFVVSYDTIDVVVSRTGGDEFNDGSTSVGTFTMTRSDNQTGGFASEDIVFTTGSGDVTITDNTGPEYTFDIAYTSHGVVEFIVAASTFQETWWDSSTVSNDATATQTILGTTFTLTGATVTADGEASPSRHDGHSSAKMFTYVVTASEAIDAATFTADDFSCVSVAGIGSASSCTVDTVFVDGLDLGVNFTVTGQEAVQVTLADASIEADYGTGRPNDPTNNGAALTMEYERNVYSITLGTGGLYDHNTATTGTVTFVRPIDETTFTTTEVVVSPSQTVTGVTNVDTDTDVSFTFSVTPDTFVQLTADLKPGTSIASVDGSALEISGSAASALCTEIGCTFTGPGAVSLLGFPVDTTITLTCTEAIADPTTSSFSTSLYTEYTHSLDAFSEVFDGDGTTVTSVTEDVTKAPGTTWDIVVRNTGLSDFRLTPTSSLSLTGVRQVESVAVPVANSNLAEGFNAFIDVAAEYVFLGIEGVAATFQGAVGSEFNVTFYFTYPVTVTGNLETDLLLHVEGTTDAPTSAAVQETRLSGDGLTFTATIRNDDYENLALKISSSLFTSTNEGGALGTTRNVPDAELDMYTPDIMVSLDPPHVGIGQDNSGSVWIIFSEAVSGLTASEFTIPGATEKTLEGSGTTYRLNFTYTPEDDTTISLASGAVESVRGPDRVNVALSASEHEVVVTPFTAELFFDAGNDTYYTVDTPFTLTMNTNGHPLELGSGGGQVDADIFSVTSGAATFASLAIIGDTVTAEVTPTESGELVISVAEGAVTSTDSALDSSNTATSITVLSSGVAVTLSCSGGDYSDGVDVTCTATFADEVEAIPGTIGDVFSLTGATLSSSSFSATEWTLVISPTGKGDITAQLDVEASSATTEVDGKTRSTFASNVVTLEYENLLVTDISLSSNTHTANSEAPVTLVFTTSKPFDVATITESDFVVRENVGDASNTDDATVSNIQALTATTFSVDVVVSARINVYVWLPAASVADTDGRTNELSETTFLPYHKVAVLSFGPSSDAPTYHDGGTTAYNFTAVYYEAVEAPPEYATDPLTLSGCTLNSVTAVSATEHVFTLSVSGVGDCVVALKTGVISDAGTSSRTNEASVGTTTIKYETVLCSMSTPASFEVGTETQVTVTCASTVTLLFSTSFAITTDGDAPTVAYSHPTLSITPSTFHPITVAWNIADGTTALDGRPVEFSGDASFVMYRAFVGTNMELQGRSSPFYNNRGNVTLVITWDEAVDTSSFEAADVVISGGDAAASVVGTPVVTADPIAVTVSIALRGTGDTTITIATGAATSAAGPSRSSKTYDVLSVPLKVLELVLTPAQATRAWDACIAFDIVATLPLDTATIVASPLSFLTVADYESTPVVVGGLDSVTATGTTDNSTHVAVELCNVDKVGAVISVAEDVIASTDSGVPNDASNTASSFQEAVFATTTVVGGATTYLHSECIVFDVDSTRSFASSDATEDTGWSVSAAYDSVCSAASTPDTTSFRIGLQFDGTAKTARTFSALSGLMTFNPVGTGLLEGGAADVTVQYRDAVLTLTTNSSTHTYPQAIEFTIVSTLDLATFTGDSLLTATGCTLSDVTWDGSATITGLATPDAANSAVFISIDAGALDVSRPEAWDTDPANEAVSVTVYPSTVTTTLTQGTGTLGVHGGGTVSVVAEFSEETTTEGRSASILSFTDSDTSEVVTPSFVTIVSEISNATHIVFGVDFTGITAPVSVVLDTSGLSAVSDAESRDVLPPSSSLDLRMGSLLVKSASVTTSSHDTVSVQLTFNEDTDAFDGTTSNLFLTGATYTSNAVDSARVHTLVFTRVDPAGKMVFRSLAGAFSSTNGGYTSDAMDTDTQTVTSWRPDLRVTFSEKEWFEYETTFGVTMTVWGAVDTDPIVHLNPDTSSFANTGCTNNVGFPSYNSVLDYTTYSIPVTPEDGWTDQVIVALKANSLTSSSAPGEPRKNPLVGSETVDFMDTRFFIDPVTDRPFTGTFTTTLRTPGAMEEGRMPNVESALTITPASTLPDGASVALTSAVQDDANTATLTFTITGVVYTSLTFGMPTSALRFTQDTAFVSSLSNTSTASITGPAVVPSAYSVEFGSLTNVATVSGTVSEVITSLDVTKLAVHSYLPDRFACDACAVDTDSVQFGTPDAFSFSFDVAIGDQAAAVLTIADGFATSASGSRLSIPGHDGRNVSLYPAEVRFVHSDTLSDGSNVATTVSFLTPVEAVVEADVQVSANAAVDSVTATSADWEYEIALTVSDTASVAVSLVSATADGTGSPAFGPSRTTTYSDGDDWTLYYRHVIVQGVAAPNAGHEGSPCFAFTVTTDVGVSGLDASDIELQFADMEADSFGALSPTEYAFGVCPWSKYYFPVVSLAEGAAEDLVARPGDGGTLRPTGALPPVSVPYHAVTANVTMSHAQHTGAAMTDLTAAVSFSRAVDGVTASLLTCAGCAAGIPTANAESTVWTFPIEPSGKDVLSVTVVAGGVNSTESGFETWVNEASETANVRYAFVRNSISIYTSVFGGAGNSTTTWYNTEQLLFAAVEFSDAASLDTDSLQSVDLSFVADSAVTHTCTAALDHEGSEAEVLPGGKTFHYALSEVCTAHVSAAGTAVIVAADSVTSVGTGSLPDRGNEPSDPAAALRTTTSADTNTTVVTFTRNSGLPLFHSGASEVMVRMVLNSPVVTTATEHADAAQYVDSSDFTTTNCVVSAVSNPSGDGKTFILTVVPTGQVQATVAVTGGGYLSSVGHVAAAPSSAFYIPYGATTVKLLSENNLNEHPGTGTFKFNVKFSNRVVGFDSTDVYIMHGTTRVTPTGFTAIEGSLTGTEWTVEFEPIAGVSYVISVPSGAATTLGSSLPTDEATMIVSYTSQPGVIRLKNVSAVRLDDGTVLAVGNTTAGSPDTAATASLFVSELHGTGAAAKLCFERVRDPIKPTAPLDGAFTAIVTVSNPAVASGGPGTDVVAVVVTEDESLPTSTTPFVVSPEGASSHALVWSDATEGATLCVLLSSEGITSRAEEFAGATTSLSLSLAATDVEGDLLCTAGGDTSSCASKWLYFLPASGQVDFVTVANPAPMLSVATTTQLADVMNANPAFQPLSLDTVLYPQAASYRLLGIRLLTPPYFSGRWLRPEVNVSVGGMMDPASPIHPSTGRLVPVDMTTSIWALPRDDRKWTDLTLTLENGVTAAMATDGFPSTDTILSFPSPVDGATTNADSALTQTNTVLVGLGAFPEAGTTFDTAVHMMVGPSASALVSPDPSDTNRPISTAEFADTSGNVVVTAMNDPFYYSDNLAGGVVAEPLSTFSHIGKATFADGVVEVPVSVVMPLDTSSTKLSISIIKIGNQLLPETGGGFTLTAPGICTTANASVGLGAYTDATELFWKAFTDTAKPPHDATNAELEDLDQDTYGLVPSTGSGVFANGATFVVTDILTSYPSDEDEASRRCVVPGASESYTQAFRCATFTVRATLEQLLACREQGGTRSVSYSNLHAGIQYTIPITVQMFSHQVPVGLGEWSVPVVNTKHVVLTVERDVETSVALSPQDVSITSSVMSTDLEECSLVASSAAEGSDMLDTDEVFCGSECAAGARFYRQVVTLLVAIASPGMKMGILPSHMVPVTSPGTEVNCYGIDPAPMQSHVTILPTMFGASRASITYRSECMSAYNAATGTNRRDLFHTCANFTNAHHRGAKLTVVRYDPPGTFADGITANAPMDRFTKWRDVTFHVDQELLGTAEASPLSPTTAGPGGLTETASSVFLDPFSRPGATDAIPTTPVGSIPPLTADQVLLPSDSAVISTSLVHPSTRNRLEGRFKEVAMCAVALDSPYASCAFPTVSGTTAVQLGCPSSVPQPGKLGCDTYAWSRNLPDSAVLPVKEVTTLMTNYVPVATSGGGPVFSCKHARDTGDAVSVITTEQICTNAVGSDRWCGVYSDATTASDPDGKNLTRLAYLNTTHTRSGDMVTVPMTMATSKFTLLYTVFTLTECGFESSIPTGRRLAVANSTGTTTATSVEQVSTTSIVVAVTSVNETPASQTTELPAVLIGSSVGAAIVCVALVVSCVVSRRKHDREYSRIGVVQRQPKRNGNYSNVGVAVNA